MFIESSMQEKKVKCIFLKFEYLTFYM